MENLNITYSMKKKIVKKDPGIILEIPEEWKANKEEFKKLVLDAISYQPDLIFQLVGRKDFKLTEEHIKTAVNARPKILIDIVVKRNDLEEEIRSKKSKSKTKNNYTEIMKLVTDDIFIDAIIKDPSILAINKSQIKNFDSKHLINKKTKNKQGKEVNGFKVTLRAEILCALRILYNVSDDSMSDEVVNSIIEKAKKSKNFINLTKEDAVIENVPTIARALIKNKDKKVTRFTDKTLSAHNYRIAHELMTLYASNLLKYKDNIANMPIREFSDTLIKNLLIKGIKVNPELYLILEELGYEKFISDKTVKYNVYKSLKSHKMLSELDKYLTKKDSEQAKGKLQAVETKKLKKQNTLTEEKELLK